MEQFKQMVDFASETAIREALVKRHPRESFLLVMMTEHAEAFRENLVKSSVYILQISANGV